MLADAPAQLRYEFLDLLSLWDERRDRRAMPRAGDISTVEISPYLANMLTVCVEARTGRLRCRSVGCELTRLYGRDLEGAYLDSLPRAFRALADPSDHALLAERRPHYTEISADEPEWTGTVERLILPFAVGDQVGEAMVFIYPKNSVRTPKSSVRSAA